VTVPRFARTALLSFCSAVFAAVIGIVPQETLAQTGSVQCQPAISGTVASVCMLEATAAPARQSLLTLRTKPFT
jgi:hypothetical protein